MFVPSTDWARLAALVLVLGAGTAAGQPTPGLPIGHDHRVDTERPPAPRVRLGEPRVEPAHLGDLVRRQLRARMAVARRCVQDAAPASSAELTLAVRIDGDGRPLDPEVRRARGAPADPAARCLVEQYLRRIRLAAPGVEVHVEVTLLYEPPPGVTGPPTEAQIRAREVEAARATSRALRDRGRCLVRAAIRLDGATRALAQARTARSAERARAQIHHARIAAAACALTADSLRPCGGLSGDRPGPPSSVGAGSE